LTSITTLPPNSPSLSLKCVHYLGAYPATYPRHRIIQTGLRELGITVEETVDQRFLPLRWLRLASRVRNISHHIPLIVGEAGNYLSPVLLEARRLKRPLIFDAFVSLLDTIEDREVGWRKTVFAPILEAIDRINNWSAARVLLDTEQTRNYFIERLGLRPEKAHVVYVGAETELFLPRARPVCEDHIFHVLFYGTFIPLQGIDIIVRAAAEVQRATTAIRFQLVGSGQTSHDIQSLASELRLTNIDFGPAYVPYSELPDLIAKADLCLGIFAERPKTQRVIPNKLYQCAAMGIPMITADTPAIREGFSSDELELVPPGDYGALAETIIRLAADNDRRQKLGSAGLRAIHERYSPRNIAKQVLEAVRAAYE